MQNWKRLLSSIPGMPGMILAFFLVLTSGCTQIRDAKPFASASASIAPNRVIVIRPDVKAFTVNAGGIELYEVEVTSEVRSNLQAAVESFGRARSIAFEFPDDAVPPTPAELTYTRLYAAIAATLQSGYFSNSLPHKLGAFDWSLGPGVATLGAASGADHALLLSYRGYRSTVGRRAVSLATATVGAMVGIAYYPGHTMDTGLVSLVNLRTGEIVWANRLSMSFADIDNLDEAQDILNQWFANFPGTGP